MAKSKDGIEVGSYQTSGINDPIDEPKQRGGNGSAVMDKPKGGTATHMFAHKRPVTG